MFFFPKTGQFKFWPLSSNTFQRGKSAPFCQGAQEYLYPGQGVEHGRAGHAPGSLCPCFFTLKPARGSSDRGFYPSSIFMGVENEQNILALGWLIQLYHQICPCFSGFWTLLENQSWGWKGPSPPSAQSGFCRPTQAVSFRCLSALSYSPYLMVFHLLPRSLSLSLV